MQSNTMPTSAYLYSIQTMNEDQLRQHKKYLEQTKVEIEKKLTMVNELQNQKLNSKQLKLI